MPLYNATATIIEVVVVLLTAFLVYRLLAQGLRATLDRITGMPAATTFYLRSLAIVLALMGLSKVGRGIDQKPEARFIEYFWAVGSNVGNAFNDSFIILMVFLGMITVLVAVLRPKHVG